MDQSQRTAMMLLLDARREARFRGSDLVLLADHDRSLWDTPQIADGRVVLDRALALHGRARALLAAAGVAATVAGLVVAGGPAHAGQNANGSILRFPVRRPGWRNGAHQRVRRPSGMSHVGFGDSWVDGRALPAVATGGPVQVRSRTWP